MEPSALERLARCSDDTEIWWDSSPLIYGRWRKEFLQQSPAEHRAELEGALEAFYRPEEPASGYLRGSTTNQPLALQALEANWQEWQPWIRETRAYYPEWSPKRLAWETFAEVAKRGADMLLPIFEASGQRYGYICAQVDPRLNHDTEIMVQQGLDLNARSPNIMIKMPGTAEGIEGVRRLAALGVATTVTLVFSVPQLVAVAEAAEAGRQEALALGVDLSRWRCNAVMMLGRFEDHPVFKQQAQERGIELSPADLRWAGIAVFKKAHRLYREGGYQSKMLAASMRLGPEVDGRQRIWHLEKLAGASAVLTIFPNIIEAFLLSYRGEPIEPRIDEEVPGEVLEKLRRIPYFRQAYEEDGLMPEDFAAYPPVMATTESFSEAMVKFERRVQGA